VLQRFQTGELDARLLIWDVGFALWRDHFLFGLGVGGFPDAFFANQFRSGLPIPAIDQPIVAHNTFLSVAAETGLVGLLLFLGMLAATSVALTRAARQRMSDRLRPIARGYLIGLVGFLVAALFLSMEVNKWLWLVVGLAVAFARFHDAETREETR
jgi:O-antigen ligase